MMAVGTFLALLLIIFTLLIFWIRKRYSRFDKYGFYYEQPEFPFGNLKGIGKKYHLIDILKKTYDKFSKLAPVHGIYMFFNANYVVTDLDVIKDMLIKNFDVFHNRGLYSSKVHDPLTGHLFLIEDQEWKNMRHKLTPTFTSGKMKMMLHTVLDVSSHMIEKLKSNQNLEMVEIKEFLAQYTTDVIGNVAFGLEMNSIENPDSKFRQMGKKVFTSQNFFGRALLFSNFRRLARKLRMRLLPTDISDFFRGIVKETVEYRLENKIERNDVLNLLMKIGTEGRVNEEKLTMDEIAAQCFIFFIAGFETSSSAASYVLYNLVRHPKIQDKLRNEIMTVLAKHDNKVTYEAMQEMKYLQMVVDETLRIYPPAAVLIRKSSENYKVQKSALEIPKDSFVFIPIVWIHRDPAYYPEPEKFDPERFSEENKNKRHPMAFIPFGDGPRNCIGNRFGLMQTKVGLIQLLSNFKFYATSRTPEKIIFNTRSPVLMPIDDIILKVEKL